MWNWIKENRAKVSGVLGAVSGLIASKVPAVAHVLDEIVKLLNN